jgi:hypothetical protein
MFSWICARCGRDNRPSATTCIQCGARFDEVPEEAVPEEAAAGEDETQEIELEPEPPPPPPPPPRRPVAAGTATRPRTLPPRPAAPPPPAPRPALPTWLLTILAFFAIVGIGSGIYFGIQYFSNRKQATSTGLDAAANTARAKLTSPLQKYVEVVGIRLVENARKQPEATFIVVNHSSNELDDLDATVTLWASTSRSEEDAIGTFTFKLRSIGANESKELTAPLNTKLKFYELPDWQNATAEVQITSP